MPLPAGIATVTVTGRFVHPDGTPMTGSVTFATPSLLTLSAADTIATGSAKIPLDEHGMIQATLIATDNGSMQPTGWAYQVVESLTGVGARSYWISLPSSTPLVDLADVAPADPARGNYVLVPGPQGPAGADGNTILSGHGAPSNSAGVDGDYWMDLDTTTLYGPKGSGTWPGSGITLVGTDMLSALAALVTAHTSATTNVHGIADTSLLETTAGAQAKADAAQAAAQSASIAKQPWVFDVVAYGAVGDGQVVKDGAMSSGSAVLTSATAAWPTSVVGKAISVKGAGANGVTTLVTTVASRQSATQITLSASNASGGAVTDATVIWGTDDTAAIQAAVDAAEAYLTSHTYARVYFPPRPYIVAGALSNAKSGNGQITFGAYSTSASKRILEFRGASDGSAAVRHWQQTTPQFAGSCLISLGVFASTSAQSTSINTDGNPGVISGPTEGHGYGVNSGGAVFSNMMAVLRDLTILTTHSSFGLTYGAANLWGVANAYLENVGYGTAGTVASPSTDYTSPGTFGTGLSVGLLLPAPGNNDHVVARNVSCGGGYTYGVFVTEHAVVDRIMVLYCWAAMVAVGTYAGSVGSVHAIKVLSASIEACTHELYIMGAGSQGVGPIIDIDQLSTESSTPNIAGSSAAAMKAALGRVRLTGLFTESGVSVSNPTGIELVDGQVPAPIKRRTSSFTASPIDRVLICDTSSGGFTATLPAADFCPTEYTLKNTGTNNLTVATTSSQLIYTLSGTGASTATVAAGQTLRVQALYNGSSWGWHAVNTPIAHASTHASGGADPVTPTAIGAVTATGGGKETAAASTASTASTTVDLAAGNVQTITLAASTTISLTGATNGVACSLSLYLKQDATGSRTLTWPASVKWPGGAAPVLSTSANKVDLVVLETLDGGTTWYGSLAGADYR